MRIGLIADIHGDFGGLQRALEILDESKVDTILCAGDVVERGHEGDRVIALLRERAIPCVKGNHEYILLSKDKSMRETGSPGGLGFRQLTDESLAYIEALPDRLSLEVGGKTILLAHATPWDDFTFAFPTSRPKLFQRIAAAANSDIVILGHTHEPLVARVGATWIFNPGSIIPAGSQTCATLDLPDMVMTVVRLHNRAVVDNVPLLEIEAGTG